MKIHFHHLSLIFYTRHAQIYITIFLKTLWDFFTMKVYFWVSLRKQGKDCNGDDLLHHIKLKCCLLGFKKENARYRYGGLKAKLL